MRVLYRRSTLDGHATLRLSRHLSESCSRLPNEETSCSIGALASKPRRPPGVNARRIWCHSTSYCGTLRFGLVA